MPASAWAGSKRWSICRRGRAQALDLEQPAAQQRAPDAARVAAAARHVDAHAEQVLARLGEDLGEADGALRVARHRVLAARALEEDERLELVRRHVRLGGGRLDLRAPARDPLRRRPRAAGRAGVEHVRRAGRRALLELVLAVVVVGERIGQRRRLAVVAGVGRGRDRRHAAGQRSSRATSAATATSASTAGAKRAVRRGWRTTLRLEPALLRFGGLGREALPQLRDQLARAVDHEIGAQARARRRAPGPATAGRRAPRAGAGRARAAPPPPRPRRAARRASRWRGRPRRGARRRPCGRGRGPGSRRRG